MPDANTLATSPVTLACCEVQGAFYALEVAYVREIVGLIEITPLPNAPLLVEGVIDLRGRLIPVLDLARVLGSGEGSRDGRARIMVLDFRGLALGLWVDAATDVLTLDSGELGAVPELATRAGDDFVRSVVRRVGEPPIMVLSVEALVASIDGALGSAGAGEEGS